MNLAIIEGERHAAQPGLVADCPACSKAMIAKCGTRRVWHWAHRGTRSCDHWWEPETAWHRAWKNEFPESWQESIHMSATGEKHIADVKTSHGKVLEFQHSFLRPEERDARESFYRDMAWVVDGARRARNGAQFVAALRDAIVLCQKPLIVSAFTHESALMQEWVAARTPVYFDFGEIEQGDGNAAVLWRFSPCPNARAYLSPIPKAQFVHAHREGMALDEAYRTAFERMEVHDQTRQAPRPGPLVGFGRYMAGRQRARRRF